MEKSANNPLTNDLPAGLSDELVENAVKQSDYPLRAKVAMKLWSSFTVVEDWGFADRGDTPIKRTLDLLAISKGEENQKNKLLSPSMNLFIKCRRSELPFVFFKSVTKVLDNDIAGLRDFPRLDGFQSNHVHVKEGNTTRYTPYPLYLGLIDHPFASSEVVVSSIFSKTNREDKTLDISGSEVYNTISSPLIEAMAYFRSIHKPRNEVVAYPSLALALCVVDAPMVLVDATKRTSTLTLTPWVRVMQEEVIKGGDRSHQDFYIDVVHIDFLQEFIQQHLIPFAQFFYTKLKEKGETLLVKPF